MVDDMIRYDLRVQQALRQVVRQVLSDAARDGLPGAHHFYITFKTGAPGVRLSARLRAQHPEEMTIVLQHQFWDLSVTEHTFEVGLSFSGVPERLLVPFEAITSFFDPAVSFGLKFEVVDEGAAAENDDVQGQGMPARPSAPPAPSGGRLAPMPAAERKPRGAGSEPATVSSRGGAKGERKHESPAVPAQPDDSGGAVVSLDAFRKKK